LFETLLTSLIQTYGPVGLAVVMVVQTILAPIPSEAVLVFAGSLGIRTVHIVIFGGLGLIGGSVIAFFIGRWGGRPLAIRLLGERWMNRVDGWVSARGSQAILLTRLVPIIPFDLISYVSGVTSLKFRDYLLATSVGALPRCWMLAVVGSYVGELLALLGMGLELIFLLGIAGLVFLAWCERRGYVRAVERAIMRRVIRPHDRREEPTR
jgi:uncharacterized membrane protein YdjX (TVP38/TMEM64 family)